jgi:hypothetical protein
MTPDRKFKMLYSDAYDYLEFKIGKEALEHKLNHYRQYMEWDFRLGVTG